MPDYNSPMVDPRTIPQPQSQFGKNPAGFNFGNFLGQLFNPASNEGPAPALGYMLSPAQRARMNVGQQTKATEAQSGLVGAQNDLAQKNAFMNWLHENPQYHPEAAQILKAGGEAQAAKAKGETAQTEANRAAEEWRRASGALEAYPKTHGGMLPETAELNARMKQQEGQASSAYGAGQSAEATGGMMAGMNLPDMIKYFAGGGQLELGGRHATVAERGATTAEKAQELQAKVAPGEAAARVASSIFPLAYLDQTAYRKGLDWAMSLFTGQSPTNTPPVAPPDPHGGQAIQKRFIDGQQPGGAAPPGGAPAGTNAQPARVNNNNVPTTYPNAWPFPLPPAATTKPLTEGDQLQKLRELLGGVKLSGADPATASFGDLFNGAGDTSYGQSQLQQLQQQLLDMSKINPSKAKVMIRALREK